MTLKLASRCSVRAGAVNLQQEPHHQMHPVTRSSSKGSSSKSTSSRVASLPNTTSCVTTEKYSEALKYHEVGSASLVFSLRSLLPRPSKHIFRDTCPCTARSPGTCTYGVFCPASVSCEGFGIRLLVYLFFVAALRLSLRLETHRNEAPPVSLHLCRRKRWELFAGCAVAVRSSPAW